MEVAPGFINPHGHLDWFLHEDNIAFQSLLQGVAIECIGNCGMAVYTMSDDYARLLEDYYGKVVDWRTLDTRAGDQTERGPIPWLRDELLECRARGDGGQHLWHHHRTEL